jgi:uncharacterized protein YndB with AHSA1/START domain
MGKNLVAKAAIGINASKEKVWDALVDPAAIKKYYFGTTVISEWHPGSSIIWKGVWKGKAYEDKGVILQFKPGQIIQYSHFSPLAGVPDLPENYHIVTFELAASGNQTLVSLSQDNNATEEEKSHSEQNWGMMLAALKRYLEG